MLKSPESKDVINYEDPEGTCKQLKLCEDITYGEMLESDLPINLKNIAEHVNS